MQGGMMASAGALAAAMPDVAEVPEIDEAARQRMREAASAIIGRLHVLAREEVTAKVDIENRWLDNLRAYHGRYDEITERNLRSKEGGERSRAFIKLSRAKSDAWEARVSDMLFPADDRNWGIRPTPVPELTSEAREAAEQAAAAVEEANKAGAEMNAAQDAGNAASAAMAQRRMNEHLSVAEAAAQRKAQADAQLAEASKRAKKMERVMEDQLVECLYAKRSRDVIADMIKLGVGILKGPLTTNRPSRRWQADPQNPNVFRLEVSPDPKPNFTRVDPWSFFPDSSATCMEDCEHTFERHLPSKKELRALAAKMGFDKEAVRQLLEEGPGLGSDRDTNHLTQIRSITGEGNAVKNRYVMWEYCGPLENDEVAMLLRAAGRDDDAVAVEQGADPLNQRQVRMFFCNSTLLALYEDYPLDSGESLYSVVSFQRGEASVLGGIGVPEVLCDTQRVINGAWRMMIDNGAMSAVPQTVIDKTKVEPEDGQWVLSPGKVWLKKSSDVAANAQPFETFSVTMNQQQIAGIIELAKAFADEECALPLIAQGDQSSRITQTANGMAILSNAANIIFRRVVKNWDDDLTTPSIRRLYDWNMQHHPSPDIKGDMNVDARGTSVLLMKELQGQNLMMITQTWTVHPQLAPMLKGGGYDAARMSLQAVNIAPDEILETEEEYQRKVERMAADAQGQQDPAVIAAQARVEAAKIAAASAKEIKEIEREIAMMSLAEKGNQSLDKINADLEKMRLQLQSKERTTAAEIAIEERNAERARAEGMEPTGSGGIISMGAERPQ